MTMASGLYLPLFRDTMDTSNAAVDMLSANNKVILVTDSETPNFETHDLYSDITAEVAGANGYTQNSKTVGGTPTWAYAATGRLKYSWSTTVQWTATGAGFTAEGMIITTDVATGLLIVASDFGAPYTASGGGTFTITAHADGIFYITLWT